MAEICCGVVSKSEASTPCEQSSRAARRRRMEIRRFKFVSGVSSPETENGLKRRKLDVYSRDCENAVENSDSDEEKQVRVAESGRSEEQRHSNFESAFESVNCDGESLSVDPCGSRSFPGVPEVRRCIGLWKAERHGRRCGNPPFVLSPRPGNCH